MKTETRTAKIVQAMGAATRKETVTRENAIDAAVNFAGFMRDKGLLSAKSVDILISPGKDSKGWVFQLADVAETLSIGGKQQTVTGRGKVYRVYKDGASGEFRAFTVAGAFKIDLASNAGAFKLAVKL